ncbi:MAG: translation initiation factor IF-2 [Proteobacteria bacterium]|nr:translation initiation factor IF-2 [Pseudomonadota bacterium]MBU1711214.1 translation initiation factor IF-2 [Pseudomonadota bacterium]
MSKIRVYELAKEIEMDSKVMAAKLIDLGYDVKSYNSSLDEEIANEIREKMQDLTTQVERKRIQTKGQTTIIRRRTRSVPLEGPVVDDIPEETSDEVFPEVSENEDLEKAAQASDVVSGQGGEPAEKAVEPEPAVETGQEDASAAVEAESSPEILQVEQVKVEVEVESKADPQAASEEEVAVEVRPKVDKKRKGFARVIMKAAIVLPQEEPKPKPKKAAKAKGKVLEKDGDLDIKDSGAADLDAHGKEKKGKRFVKFHTEPKERFRPGVKKKGRVDVEIEDVDAFGGRIPAGLRVGRTHRPGGKRSKFSTAVEVAETKAIKKRIKILEFISVADLSHRMGVRSNEVIAKLMGLGLMATLNQALDIDTATLIATDFGYEVEAGMTDEQSVLDIEVKEQGGEEFPRPPVVTVMGHVDHGKTSILDAIRKTDVAAGEAGGITQHIGAHYVRSVKGDVVFLDTPGHAAFTEMRSRGAKVTDVVVLVVSADDGVMDQTREAINHARAAEVPIVVAVNKIDKPNADPERVKRELADLNLVAEDWGGDTIFCETSAKQNIGIEELLEQILLQAEILELKADPKRLARGRVIEAQLHKGRGPVATILIQQGTLRVGDTFVVGNFSGKVRSLSNDKGEDIKEAGPSMPVEVHGLNGVPQAGDELVVVLDEKLAKSLSAQRQLKSREIELAVTSKISLDNLYEKLKEGDIKELRVILRADVQGTLGAFGKAIEELSTDEIKVKILHEGTGTILEADVLLAAASEALIIGFNVRPNIKIQEMAKKEKVDIRFYDVIYHALDDIRLAMVGLLDPTYEEKVIGTVEVRETFHVPKIGTIAGSYVLTGKIERNSKVRVLRDGVVMHTGNVSSLRRFKDDAKEVLAGYECGVGVENFNDIKIGDIFEAFVMVELERKL